MEINLGSVKMPLNSATKTFAILGIRGSGKTHTGAVLAEEFFKNGIPFVIFDPIDVWWGLRFAKDGKSKGLPVVVFGMEHADIKLEKDMGRDIARAVVENNISCVISTFGMSKTAQRHLIAEFAEELLNINKTPRHIFIEEAHEFVPQRVLGGLGVVFNAVSNLVVMGRNRGIGVTLINQRAATVNKDVLTQVGTLLAMRLSSPQDRKALAEWVEFNSAEGDFEKFAKSLPGLPTGEGWIWSPEFLKVFERMKIRHRETFHPDREKLETGFEMPVLDQIDVQEFIQKFSKRLPKEVKDGKKREVKQLSVRTEIYSSQPIAEINSQIIELQNLRAERNQTESKLIEKDVEIRRLQGIMASMSRILGGESQQNSSYSVATGNLDMWVQKLGNNHMSRILKMLGEKRGLKFNRGQVAIMTGISPRSSAFFMAISNLKKNKLIVETPDGLMVNPDL